YQKATGTKPFPPQFQRLVQKAIDGEVLGTTRFANIEHLAVLLGYVSTEKHLLVLIAHYADMLPYTLSGFIGTLLQHQLVALEYAFARDNSLLALDMGLGKTPTSYAYIATKNFAKVLLVVPPALKDNWKEEGKKFLRPDDWRVHDINSAKNAPKVLATPGGRIFIISYSLLDAVLEDLVKVPWDAMICDEAHAFKNWRSSRSKAGFALR